MARPKKDTGFENRISEIISRAVSEAAAQVRRDLTDELRRLVGAPAPSASSARVEVRAAVGRASKKKRREWPKCSAPNCTKNMFGPSGDARLCFDHFKAAGGKHYSQASSSAAKRSTGRKAAQATGRKRGRRPGRPRKS